MVVSYPPEQVRYEDGRPVALLGVRLTSSPLGGIDQPLGLATTTARSRRGTWALYPLGAEVVVVHPDGALTGTPAEVAVELDRLIAHGGHGDLDRMAARTIQRLLTGDVAHDAGSGQKEARTATWSTPAKGYRVSGPSNQHQGPVEVAAAQARAKASTATAGRAVQASAPTGAASRRSRGSHLVAPRVRRHQSRRVTRSTVLEAQSQ
jgi:hypothetical protein